MNYTGDELFWIAICDDEREDAREIMEILMEGEMEPGEFMISSYPSGEALLKANVSRYDLLILDIMFPGENGRDIADAYRSRNKDGLFVYCTGKASPIPADFRNAPYRFMRKENMRQLRKDILDTVEEMYRRKTKHRLKLTKGKTVITLNVEDILYFEIAKNGSCVYYYEKTGELQAVKVREKVKEIYSKVFAYGFEFPHNSYLVNCHYLRRWDNHELEFINGTHLNISRAHEKKFRQTCLKYIT